MLAIKKIEGLVAAPFSLMDAKGNLNIKIVPQYYRMLEKNGVAGALINGSTGEGASLTQKEKQLHASKWAECLHDGGKFREIYLVGGTSYSEFRSPVYNMTDSMYSSFVKDVKLLKMEKLFSKYEHV